MDESLSHRTGARQDSTRNHEYDALPKCIKSSMTEKEWLWHQDKSSLIDEMTEPEVAED